MFYSLCNVSHKETLSLLSFTKQQTIIRKFKLHHIQIMTKLPSLITFRQYTLLLYSYINMLLSTNNLSVTSFGHIKIITTLLLVFKALFFIFFYALSTLVSSLQPCTDFNITCKDI